MKTEALSASNRAEFEAYCRKHRFDHDESFLSDRELAGLDLVGGTDRGLLLRGDSSELRGVAALMLKPELRAAGKARFRILHVEAGLEADAGAGAEAEAYRLLTDGLLPLAAGLDWVYLFLPERVDRPAAIVQDLGFSIERYAWLLERSLAQVEPPSVPQGFTLREGRLFSRESEGGPGADHKEGARWGAGPDVEAWCAVVNEAFERLAGHTELNPARLAAEYDPELAFPGSYLFLYAEGREEPVGIVSTVRDVDDETGSSAYLGPVGVIPEFQGRGLGRALLRAGLAAAQKAGYQSCFLSVNSENGRAADLYLDEGFMKKDVYVCWHKRP